MKVSVAGLIFKDGQFRKITMNNLKVLFVSIIITFAGAAHSTMETVEGDTVIFSYDSALSGLFGDPSVVGDAISFNPVDFVAIANNDDGRVITNETFNIKVMGKGGNQLTSAALIERGDYMVDPLGGGVAVVGVTGQLRATNSADPMQYITDDIEAQNPFVETGFKTENWSADAGLDLLSFSTDTVVITIENILLAATSNLLDGAFIEKKQVILSMSAVPVPAAVWFMATAMLGLLTVGRRKGA